MRDQKNLCSRSVLAWLFVVCVVANPAEFVQAQSQPVSMVYSAAIPAVALKATEPKPETELFSRLPKSLDELQKFEAATLSLIPDYQAATVGIQVGQGQGSGVVVSPQGHILTAAHVVGEVGAQVTIVFPDGRRHLARVAGVDPRADAAIVRMEGKGPYPYIPMAQNHFAASGRWAIAIGHPNGYSSNRLPVIRVGRVIQLADKTVQTDCSLVGGDSGGPLFDMEGRVVGIHSRIGISNSINFHVPVQIYLNDWDTLNAGYSPDHENSPAPKAQKAYLGIRGRDAASRGCLVTEVTPQGPAETAGIKRGDVLIQADGKSLRTFAELVVALKDKQPDEEIEFTLLRSGKRETIRVTLSGTEI